MSKVTTSTIIQMLYDEISAIEQGTNVQAETRDKIKLANAIVPLILVFIFFH